MSCFSHRLIATAVVAALSLPVLAQTSAPTQATQATPAAAQAEPGQHMQRDHQMRSHALDRAKMQERRAQRMAAFQEKLQLTPAQQPAWEALQAAMQPGERHARLDRQGMEQLTTPERIDRMRAMRIQRAAQADQRGEAVKAFYAALTPDQQKTFDAQSRRMQGKYGQHNHGAKRHKAHRTHKADHHRGMHRHNAPAPAADAPAANAS